LANSQASSVAFVFVDCRFRLQFVKLYELSYNEL
jgi:hypothetical protein